MTQPEQWEVRAGDAGVATLDLPPDAHRDRTFEVSVDWSVRALSGASAPWHELQVLLNGARQWARRVPTHPGPGDSLDYRVRRVVPAGEALRVSAVTQSHQVLRLALRITAQEE